MLFIRISLERAPPEIFSRAAERATICPMPPAATPLPPRYRAMFHRSCVADTAADYFSCRRHATIHARRLMIV
jgi:hypothetical protein